MKHRGGSDSWEDHLEPASHSKKNCWCGGHNTSNAKSNLNHHGTKMRFWARQRRKVKDFYKKIARIAETLE